MILFTGSREMEKMTEDLKVIKDKGKSFRQSIVSLLVQWRDFEGQLNLIDNNLNFSTCFGVLESREYALEQREKDILLFFEKKKKFLELKEEKLIKFVENYAVEVEKKFIVQEERVSGLLEKLESRKLEMLGIKNFVEKMLLEMGEKENHFVSIQDSLEKQRLEVEEKENICKERAKEIEFKVQELNLMIQNNEYKEKQVDSIREIFEKQLNDLNRKEEIFENKFKLLKVKENRIEDLEINGKQFVYDTQSVELESHAGARANVASSHERRLHSHYVRDIVKPSPSPLDSCHVWDKVIDSCHIRDNIVGSSRELDHKKNDLEHMIKDLHLKERKYKLEKEKLVQQSEILEARIKEFDKLIEDFKTKNSFEKLLHSKESEVTLEKEKLTPNYKILEPRKRNFDQEIKDFNTQEKRLKISLEELHLEESKVTWEKETHEMHKKGFNFEEKEGKESSKGLQQQFSYHLRNKYPERTTESGTFRYPRRKYHTSRFNGKRR